MPVETFNDGQWCYSTCRYIMEEILKELEDKLLGMNCDHWGQAYVDSFDAAEIVNWLREKLNGRL